MIEVKVPFVNINDETVKILDLFPDNGEKVKDGQLLAEIESTKASEEVLSPSDGFIYFFVKAGDEVRVGGILAGIFKTRDQLDAYLKGQEENREDGFPATNKARKLAKELNVDLKDVIPSGRIIREKDILLFLKRRQQDDKQNLFIFPEGGALAPDFIERLKQDRDFEKLPSGEKKKLYAQHGAVIEDGVVFEENAFIIANSIVIKEKARIGRNSKIVADKVFIGKMSEIGSEASISIREFFLGDMSLIGDKSFLGGADSFGPYAGIYIAEMCFVGRESLLDAGDGIVLFRHACLSPRVSIFTHSHWQDYLKGYNPAFGKVIIEEDAHIGGGVLIGPAVIVGKGSFIMGNSLVVNNIPAYEIWGGVPAQYARKINLVSDVEEKQRRFEKLFPKLLQDLKSRGIDISEIEYISNAEINSVKKNGIILCFGCGGNIDKTTLLDKQACIFDLERYKFLGFRSKRSDYVRNFLRRHGIKFFPIYWNPGS